MGAGRTGRPRHRAIVWQDRRTAARCDEIAAAGHLPTGAVAAPGWCSTPTSRPPRSSGCSTEGGVEDDADLALGTIDSWLVWNLTGGQVHVTEPSNASRTMLFDISTLSWSDELCDLFGVPMHALPDIGPSSGRFGVTVEGSGVTPGVPISGIAGDQQAALFGQACFEPGMTKNTYGTGSFVLMNVGPDVPEPVDGLLTTVGWSLETVAPASTTYVLEGAIFATGAAIQWLRDGLEIIDDASEIEALASSVPHTDGVVLVPAFAGLGSPCWDPYARGTIVGLTRGTTRAHLARATVEAMAYQTRDVVDTMSAASGRGVASLRADGGASVMRLLLQLQADQLGVPVTRPVVQETTALGAAYLAGLAEGVWTSTSEIAEQWAVDVEVQPTADRTAADADYARWKRAVERSRGWSLE